MAIIPAFYAVLALAGVPVADARAAGWLFDSGDAGDDDDGGARGVEEADATWKLIWTPLTAGRVHWGAAGECAATIVALVLFSLMHVPINIPSLAISLGEGYDINAEACAVGRKRR